MNKCHSLITAAPPKNLNTILSCADVEMHTQRLPR